MSKIPPNPNPNKPHPDLFKILEANNVKVMFKKDGPDLLLWCNYGEHTKNKKEQGLEIWGRGIQIVERISSTVYSYYPRAEVTSQSGNAHIVFRLNG